jgi:hypothetical protein
MAVIHPKVVHHRAELRETVPAGTTGNTLVLLQSVARNGTVVVSPGTGGTAVLEFSISLLSLVTTEDASVIWTEWSCSTVSESTAAVIDSATTAIRCTATTADAVVELRQ